MFDGDLIKKVYEKLPGRIQKAREKLKRPLTYAEKILYGHLFENQSLDFFERGKIM